MKKFENPIINVSLFDVENIVTNGSDVKPPVQKTAVEQALEEAGTLVAGSKDTIQVTF